MQRPLPISWCAHGARANPQSSGRITDEDENPVKNSDRNVGRSKMQLAGGNNVRELNETILIQISKLRECK